MALSDTGEVWTWGRGDEGQLGHGNNEPSSRPMKVAFDAAGGGMSAGGRVVRDREPGAASVRGPGDVVVVAVACGRQHSAALDNDGKLWTWGCGDDGALGHGSLTSHCTPQPVT